MEFVKGLLLLLAIPVLPFVGSILICMFYQFILSLPHKDYELRRSFEQCARLAFEPLICVYFLILLVVVLVLLGFDPATIS